jgi:hypothetical protein
MRASWLPLIWYVGVAVALPILNGAPFGLHMATTLAVAAGFFGLLRLGAALRGRIKALHLKQSMIRLSRAWWSPSASARSPRRR